MTQATPIRTTPIRVFLVDDQTLVRQGIRSLLALAEGIEVVAEASDGRQAVEQIPGISPDVVLMDMRMPVMSGLEALQAMSRTGTLPPTAAVCCTSAVSVPAPASTATRGASSEYLSSPLRLVDEIVSAACCEEGLTLPQRQQKAEQQGA